MPFNSTSGGLSSRAYGFKNSGIPDAPNAPTVTSVNNESTDVVTWSAPKNNGSPITIYYWESTDGKSGSTSSTSVNVVQEAATSQQYRVRAVNSNGTSAWSQYSASFTSFSFSPFGFTPFGFTPFGFTPFGFTPFGFTPFAWLGGGNSVAPEISVLLKQNNGFSFVDISMINNQDVVLSMDIKTKEQTESIVVYTNEQEYDEAMMVDGEVYTLNNKMFVRKNNVELFVNVLDLDTTYEKFSTTKNDFVQIFSVEKIESYITGKSIVCNTINNYITNSVVLSNEQDF